MDPNGRTFSFSFFPLSLSNLEALPSNFKPFQTCFVGSIPNFRRAPCKQPWHQLVGTNLPFPMPRKFPARSECPVTTATWESASSAAAASIWTLPVARRSADHYDWAWLGDVSPYVWNLNFHAIDIHYHPLTNLGTCSAQNIQPQWIILSQPFTNGLLCWCYFGASQPLERELHLWQRRGPKHICPKELTILAHAPAEWTPWNMKHGNWLRCILQSCEHTHTHAHVNHVNHVIYL
jgi:hypothetical protein